MAFAVHHGFDVVPQTDVVSGLAIYRFAAPLGPIEHAQFIGHLEQAGLASTNGALDGSSIPALPAIGLKRMFAIGYQPPKTREAALEYHRLMEHLGDEFGLSHAWAFLVDTCVDVTERRTTGEIRWRNGAPSTTPRTFPCQGDLNASSGHSIERFAVNFELAENVCPESAGVLVAFCQHWLAPYTDHVARKNNVLVERSDARCYILGDINIGTDGRTVRFRMDHLIPPGNLRDCLDHTLGVISQIDGVLPVQRAWLACA